MDDSSSSLSTTLQLTLLYKPCLLLFVGWIWIWIRQNFNLVTSSYFTLLYSFFSFNKMQTKIANKMAELDIFFPSFIYFFSVYYQLPFLFHSSSIFLLNKNTTSLTLIFSYSLSFILHLIFFPIYFFFFLESKSKK